MKITFNLSTGSKTSPTFTAPPEHVVEDFWDEFLGGSDDQENELFWNCDVSGQDDEIIVDWFEDPADLQKMVDNLSKGLKTLLPPFGMWT
jgi:hypothetical protein